MKPRRQPPPPRESRRCQSRCKKRAWRAWCAVLSISRATATAGRHCLRAGRGPSSLAHFHAGLLSPCACCGEIAAVAPFQLTFKGQRAERNAPGTALPKLFLFAPREVSERSSAMHELVVFTKPNA